eukprot:3941729-Rhodomonas_salina.2
MPGTARAYGATLQTQIQETAFCVQFVLKMRFLVFDFGVLCAYVPKSALHETLFFQYARRAVLSMPMVL